MGLKLTLIFVLLISFAAHAANDKLKSNLATNEISGEVQLMSEFIERGLSMSDDNPAMNASFLYNLGEQVKMGFWGSNISNISAADDNFWFKLLAEIKVEYSPNFNNEFYISDNHFYKSDVRNGQRLGVLFNYYTYTFTIEWMSNFEGSKSNAEYLEAAKVFYWGNKFRYGGAFGYTLGHHVAINNYFNVKATAQYLLNTETFFELTGTIASNTNYGSRGDAAVYGALNINY